MLNTLNVSQLELVCFCFTTMQLNLLSTYVHRPTQ